jgi:hypothetical protein
MEQVVCLLPDDICYNATIFIWYMLFVTLFFETPFYFCLTKIKGWKELHEYTWHALIIIFLI